jgi:ferritin-like metal-binding protein YciE
MTRIVCFAAALLYLGAAARAQDVQGIELCTHETRMDRRTSCLQSNIDYLQGLIAKRAAETLQKLTAAAGEIGALKGEIASLKAALAGLQARVEKLEVAAKSHAKPAEPPVAKPTEKPAQPAAK